MLRELCKTRTDEQEERYFRCPAGRLPGRVVDSVIFGLSTVCLKAASYLPGARLDFPWMNAMLDN